MKKSGMSLLLILSLAFFLGADQPPLRPDSPTCAGTSPSGVRVTFVGNAGFLVTIGGKKVLIDAIFAGFPGDYQLPKDVRESLVNARPPFDNVDLILITHYHDDHFNAPMVRQYLKNNPKARLISTAQVTDQLPGLGSRVITAAATKGNPAQTNIDGIQVKALYLPHVSPPPAGQIEDINFGYIVTVNDLCLFHTGDCVPKLIDMTVPPSPGKRIDLAFIGHFYFKEDPFCRRLIQEWINGKYVFPVHYAYSGTVDRNRIKSICPEAILFEKEMQSWDMPK